MLRLTQNGLKVEVRVLGNLIARFYRTDLNESSYGFLLSYGNCRNWNWSWSCSQICPWPVNLQGSLRINVSRRKLWLLAVSELSGKERKLDYSTFLVGWGHSCLHIVKVALKWSVLTCLEDFVSLWLYWEKQVPKLSCLLVQTHV